MLTTKHAQQRMKQRHISEEMLVLATLCGKKIKHTDKIRLQRNKASVAKAELFALIKALEKVQCQRGFLQL